MANKPGDSLGSTSATLYVIEATVLAGSTPVWSPVPVGATHHTRKFKDDQNRVKLANMIDLSGIMAYRHLEHADAAYKVIVTGAKATQFRIVKIDSTIVKRFVSGADSA